MKKNLLSLSIIIIASVLMGCSDSTYNSTIKYYVSSTSHSSNWEAAQNIGTPCDVTSAFANAVAGDTVLFRGGTYTVPQRNSGNWLSGYYNPANSGTEKQPIVFKAYPGEVPLFDGTSGGSADKDGHKYYGYATLFGINNYTPSGNSYKEYIVYDGFSFQADGGKSEARITLARGDNGFSGQRGRGIVIKNCIFNGGTNVHPPYKEGGTGDNHEGLFISQLTGLEICNCKFLNYQHETNNHNTSAIKAYHCDHLVVKNCEIYNSTIGVFYKSNIDDSTISYNYIHDCNIAVLAGTFGWWRDSADHSKGYFISETDNLEIYHNILTNSKRVNISIENGDGASTDGMKIFNNTFYTGNQKGVSTSLSSGIGQEFYNNLLYGLKIDGDIGLLKWSCSHNDPEKVAAGIRVELGIDSVDHNQFGDLPNNLLIRIREPDESTDSYTSLDSWQTSGVLTDGENPGEGSMASDPKFLNTSGTMSKVEDFTLAAKSPCKRAGRNGVDIGADASLVGIQ